MGKYADQCRIPDDLYPEVVVYEPRQQDSLGGFARGICRELDGFEMSVPVTGARGWIRSLYLSGCETTKHIESEFYSRECDVALFSNATRMADIWGLIGGYINQLPCASWVHSGECILPEELQDKSSWMINVTNWEKSRRIYCGSEYTKRIVEGEVKILSPEMQEKLLRKVVVLPMGYDFAQYDSWVRPSPRQKERPVIIWNHRTDFDRNPAGFARILEMLHDSGQDFELILSCVEKGQIPAWKRTMAKLQETGKISHRGFAKGDDYKRLLDRADIVVSTALTETFGFSVAEATYCGVIPLVPDSGAYKDLYPESCRFRPGDERDAAMKLGALLSTVQSGDQLFGRWSELADERARFRIVHDWSVCRELYRDSFRELWFDECSNIPPTLTKATQKAYDALMARGPLTKREMIRAIGWDGMDYFVSTRWKLLNSGVRSQVIGNESWYYPPTWIERMEEHKCELESSDSGGN